MLARITLMDYQLSVHQYSSNTDSFPFASQWFSLSTINWLVPSDLYQSSYKASVEGWGPLCVWPVSLERQEWTSDSLALCFFLSICLGVSQWWPLWFVLLTSSWLSLDDAAHRSNVRQEQPDVIVVGRCTWRILFVWSTCFASPKATDCDNKARSLSYNYYISAIIHVWNKESEVAKSVWYHWVLVPLLLSILSFGTVWPNCVYTWLSYVRWFYKKTQDSLESLWRVFSI